MLPFHSVKQRLSPWTNHSRRSFSRILFTPINRSIHSTISPWQENVRDNLEHQHDPASITVNATELEKFNNLSHEWWSPNGSLGLLHRMNGFRIPYIKKQLLKTQKQSQDENAQIYPLRGFKILDIGCGGGILSEPLARLGATVIGADASSQGIEVAKLHAKKDPALFIGPGSLDYRCTTIEQLLKENEPKFDLVCAMEIIEHVDDSTKFIKACSGLVKPDGGQLILSTISRTPLSYLLTILIAENFLRIVPEKTHDYLKYIMPEELKDTIENDYNSFLHEDDDLQVTEISVKGNDPKKDALRVTDITGVWYNLATEEWVEFDEKNHFRLSVNYFMTAEKFKH
ncbi:5223_t:CDS:2 [Ambispora gerdemannii]|uniref:Ubiquinone biosynthesis O-methyltransferase, mitochondrial n=1 Tax=Ambispora gerdemannii TaxID=144530 RepID=A0A9N8W1G5_9GLOM|nr:5223_t:CDS:2 [Ambispora gerdemannii]